MQVFFFPTMTPLITVNPTVLRLMAAYFSPVTLN